MIKAALIAAGALLLAGCSTDMSDLERYVAEVKARKTTKIEPIPQPTQYENFIYDPAGRRDPFVEILADKRPESAGTGPAPDLDRKREALEAFPLDALRMVGTIRAPDGTFALIKAPDGVIHRVTVRNHMGQNYGRIVAISEAEVSLIELVPDGFGGWNERPASLTLAQ
ncbi:MAG: pilus assembly protein PilP [Nevskiales bacterium]|nr:pilus assembly protein PilP [Nevskiales bacterium]